MRMTDPLARVVLGFAAGAIAVVIGHQVMILLLSLFGLVSARPWSMAPNPWGVPQLFNLMFWGGIWGIVFALVAPALARLATWQIGLIVGMVGNTILGNWLLLPLVLGRGNVLAGGVPLRMVIGLAIGAAFGVAWAYVYRALRTRMTAGAAAY